MHVPSESVDSDIDRLEGIDAVLAVDNVSKFWLQRSSSDKESINIRLRRKIGRRLGVGRSTVQNSCIVSNLGADDLTQILANGFVRILGLLWGGGQTCSNRPDRFVGNDNIFPVVSRKDVGIGLNLWENEFVGGTGLTVFLGFATACHDLQSFIKSKLSLGGNFGVRFALATALRMSDDCCRQA